MSEKRKVLYIGGHGKIALLATPLLVAAEHEVHSLVRNPDYAPELENLGAKVIIADITALDVAEWAGILEGFDDVIWGAGNGGRAGADATYAIDRDGALAMIDALETLTSPPRLIMISYRGATHRTAPGDGSSWDAYVQSKKAVDLRLGQSELTQVILGPSALTDEPAAGLRVVPDDTPPAGTHTSRELVAQVLVGMVSADSWPPSPYAFIDD